jgi:hypothetical protein
MNHDLQIGDRLEIISDRVGNKLLANVELGEVITVTGMSDDRKIIYHHGSLALPNSEKIFRTVNKDYSESE